MSLPLKTRCKIQEFVAKHEDCEVVWGPLHPAWYVTLTGVANGNRERLVLGQPRRKDSAEKLLDGASIMVAGLERGKQTERARVVLHEIGKHIG